jgi:hypothetical protein
MGLHENHWPKIDMVKFFLCFALLLIIKKKFKWLHKVFFLFNFIFLDDLWKRKKLKKYYSWFFWKTYHDRGKTLKNNARAKNIYLISAHWCMAMHSKPSTMGQDCWKIPSTHWQARSPYDRKFHWCLLSPLLS